MLLPACGAPARVSAVVILVVSPLSAEPSVIYEQHARATALLVVAVPPPASGTSVARRSAATHSTAHAG